MKMRHVAATGALAGIGLLAAPGLVSAHVDQANPSCTQLHVGWQLYPTPSQYTITVVIDGATTVLPVAGNGQENFPWDKHVNHAWSATSSKNGPIGSGTWEACDKPDETTTTTAPDDTTTTTEPEATTTTVADETTTTTADDTTTTVLLAPPVAGPPAAAPPVAAAPPAATPAAPRAATPTPHALPATGPSPYGPVIVVLGAAALAGGTGLVAIARRRRGA